MPVANRPTLSKRCRVPIAAALALLPAGAATAAGRAPDMLDRALAIVKQHRLLTPAELACSTFVDTGTEAGIGNVTVAEKHGGRCRGDPATAPARFHLEIDTRSGRARWDHNDDREMRPVP